MLTWALSGIALLCAAGFAIWMPFAAIAVWMAVIEATPDLWRSGDHELLLAAMKGAGLVLVPLLALREGWRRDRYNPGFAFAALFCSGILHGLYPGLTLMSSMRSLIGSAGPFAFSFAATKTAFRRLVTAMAIAGPLINLLTGSVLGLLHIHAMYQMDGSFRLAGAGQPAFLGGFALIAIYAGLLELLHREDVTGEATWPVTTMLGFNTAILVLSGARTPMALAFVLMFGCVLLRRRVMALAGCGALLAFAVLFLSRFSFLRAASLLQGGQAENLSNRNLIWPEFWAAIERSPWVGWGVGAGKQIVPATTGIGVLLGTTAAHNEYLRIGVEGGFFGLLLLVLCMGCWVVRGSRPLPPSERWFMRLVFVAFAVHSATDNTLIATTSSVLFIWASAVFSAAAKPFDEAC